MKAPVIDLADLKRAHPPIIVFLNAGMVMALAWQKLWLMLAFPKQSGGSAQGNPDSH